MNAQPSPIRILLADDHPVLRQGIQALAADQSDIQFVAEAAPGRDAIEASRRHAPDVSLMGLRALCAKSFLTQSVPSTQAINAFQSTLPRKLPITSQTTS